jgi:N-acetylglutamate synthase-like GNAT family acetyltransferase
VRDAADDAVGCFGLEFLDDEALLRSVAVRPDRRGERLGSAIVATAEQIARARGVRRLVLLTDSADRFFERLGYARVERADVSEPMRRTRQFTTICPASAACMAKAIAEAASLGR